MNKLNLKTNHLIILGLIQALNIIWFVCDLIAFQGHMLFSICLTLFELIVVVLYGIYGYKRPHSNSLRYLMLFHTAVDAYLLLTGANYQPMYVNVVYLLSIILVSYMAGRLDHFKTNIILCAIVLICYYAAVYYLISLIIDYNMGITFVSVSQCIYPVTVWLAISSAYIVRYRIHKEVGLKNQK
ncbi:MAG: hypothetical protein Q4E33_04355 [Erysipelotrichaceae bacterium]|nr:hypothetical protein [Erysipelotrichaceae bacterium]